MKDKNVAGVLAILFGVFGVHRFYLGQTVLGVLYLVLMFTGISAIVGFIDGILLLAAPQEAFDAKYNQRYLSTEFHRKARIKRRHQVKTTHQEHKRTNRKPSKTTRPAKRERPTGNKKKQKALALKKKALSHFKAYEFKEAELNYQKALALTPQDKDLLFNLACLYSSMEDTEKSLDFLEEAIELGYSDFDRINTVPSLAHLRVQDEFVAFVDAGYKQMKQEVPEQDDEEDLLEQLRRLKALRDQGKMTEAQFLVEKEKLMN